MTSFYFTPGRVSACYGLFSRGAEDKIFRNFIFFKIDQNNISNQSNFLKNTVKMLGTSTPR